MSGANVMFLRFIYIFYFFTIMAHNFNLSVSYQTWMIGIPSEIEGRHKVKSHSLG